MMVRNDANNLMEICRHAFVESWSGRVSISHLLNEENAR